MIGCEVKDSTNAKACFISLVAILPLAKCLARGFESIVFRGNMKFLSRDQEASVAEIDKNVKNKFRWDWLQRTVTMKVKLGKKIEEISETLEQFIKKCDLPGKAFCIYCNDVINYGSRGCVALIDHASKVKKHSDVIALH